MKKQAENAFRVGSGKNSNSLLYSGIKKSKRFLNEKNIKMKKRSHAFKSYASSYNVQILNSFNPELKLKKYSICK